MRASRGLGFVMSKLLPRLSVEQVRADATTRGGLRWWYDKAGALLVDRVRHLGRRSMMQKLSDDAKLFQVRSWTCRRAILALLERSIRRVVELGYLSPCALLSSVGYVGLPHTERNDQK